MNRCILAALVPLAAVAIGCGGLAEPAKGKSNGKAFGPLKQAFASSVQQSSSTVVRAVFDCPAFTPKMIDKFGNVDGRAVDKACPKAFNLTVYLYDPAGAPKVGLYGTHASNGTTGVSLVIGGAGSPGGILREVQAGQGREGDEGDGDGRRPRPRHRRRPGRDGDGIDRGQSPEIQLIRRPSPQRAPVRHCASSAISRIVRRDPPSEVTARESKRTLSRSSPARCDRRT